MPHQDQRQITLAAFLKGDDQLRKQIAATLIPDQFFGWDWLYELMLQLFNSTGKLAIEDLYTKTKDMVRGHLPAHLSTIDTIFAVELSDEQAVNDAMSLLLSDEPRTFDRQDWAEETLLAAMLKGTAEIQAQILLHDYSEDFEDFDRANLMKWATELYSSKGSVLKEDLTRRMEEYMLTNILASYTIRIDHLRETEMPDKDSLDAAILWVEQHQIRRKAV